MEKRRKKRFARRIQVKYWPEGEEHERKGYTTNVSTIGVFIASNAPVPPGTRMRIEFLGPAGFIVESKVAHSARVSASLQSIRSSGMGIRFLLPSELVRELLPAGGEGENEDVAASHASEPGYDRFYSLTAEELGSGPKKRAAGASGAPVYTVGFRNVAYLLDALETEMTFGGVFVPTDSPATLHEPVRIALALPAPIKRTVHASATVVQVVGPSPDGGMGGMGVAFNDTQLVVAELHRWIDWARPKPDGDG
jgi:Tfp pilus assembly protein PilZ